MFQLADSWVWDHWYAQVDGEYHLFFLWAKRGPDGPDARHFQAAVGHAVSTDLVNWRRVAEALARSEPPAFDDLATWTGSVVRHPDGRWYLFYTGATMGADGRNAQSVGLATSPDLLTWTKRPEAVLQPDPAWYETLETSHWQDQAFRDPWVLADPQGNGWHMLITARANHGATFDRGVVGHAWSADLDSWGLRPPLSAPVEGGFGQLEVIQVEVIDGRPVMIFSCLAEHAAPARRGNGGGIWAAPAASLLGPFDIAGAYQLTDDQLYAGRLIRGPGGRWLFTAFRQRLGGEAFLGRIVGPWPVVWQGSRLAIVF